MTTSIIPHRSDGLVYAIKRPAVRVNLFDAKEEDAKAAGPAWVIDGLIQEGVNVLYGSPGSGKTFVALDMAMYVATSEPLWHGRRVKGGPVVYVAAEDGRGVSQRRSAWRQFHEVSDDREHMLGYNEPIYLTDPEYVKAFIAGIQVWNVAPVLVVFDTLARCVPGKDENGSGDMGVAVDSLERIVREVGAKAVLLVHHPGKEGRGPRGSSAIPAAAQAVIKLKGNPTEGITLTPEKQRNGAVGDGLTLTFRGVGDTLVIERGNEKPWKPQSQKPSKPRITQEMVIDALHGARKSLTEQEVAERVGCPQAIRAIRAHLTRLCTEGKAHRDEVGYRRGAA